MAKDTDDRTLALAGVLQAAMLVQQVAHRGSMEPQAAASSLGSVFVTDPRTTDEVYGGVAGVATGLKGLREQLSRAGAKDAELLRYVIALLHLSGKLLKRRPLLDVITQAIDRARRQRDHFAITHENVIAGLADAYVNTISTLTPRIMVTGEQGLLSHQENADKVRALLLAGIRSAILWRQSGGTRLGLLLSRRAYLDAAERLLGGL